MSIQVTCQKCHKRFKVSEKFAGKSGPCPNCQAPIRVPTKSEEVVIHAPEGYGPKGTTGQAVLKPIQRQDVRASPVAVVGVLGVAVASIIVAIVLRMMYPQGTTPWGLLVAGAVVLAPPLALSGYWFLRNDELEPHRGGALALRIGICALLYAGLWGVYALVKQFVFHGNQPEIFHFAVIGPALLLAGGTAGLATLDLDLGTAALHFAFYLLVTVVFCFILGVPAY